MTAHACGCGSYGYDPDDCGDGFVVGPWREGRTERTRVERKCYECDGVIPVGSRCCWVTFLDKDASFAKWRTWHRCVTCATIAELVADKNKACPPWGGLRATALDSGFDWDALHGSVL